MRIQLKSNWIFSKFWLLIYIYIYSIGHHYPCTIAKLSFLTLQLNLHFFKKFYQFLFRHTTNITLLFTINNIWYLYFLYQVFCKIFWDCRIIILTFVLNLSLVEPVLTKFKIYNGCDRKWKTSYWILFFIFEKILNTNLSSPYLNQKKKRKEI